MSTFDPQAFEEMVFEEANETKFTPIPEGVYEAIVDSVRIKAIDIKKGDRAGTTAPILEVVYEILSDDLKKELNREKVVVRHDIWLDVNENGSLSFGPNHNVQLGRLREACGLNKPGKPFSFQMLQGQGPLKVTVAVKVNMEADVAYNNVIQVQRAA